MMLRGKLGGIGVALALAAGTIAQAPAASAGALGCAADPAYDFSGVRVSYIDSGKVYGGGGVTLTLTETRTTTITGTIGGQVGGGVSFLIWSADAQVNGAISLAKTTTYTQTGSWTVPTNQATGWLAIGAQSSSMSWAYGSYSGSCKWVVSHTGTANLPTLAPYWHHS